MNSMTSSSLSDIIASEEVVARILSKEWFVRGKLLSVAFALESGETYLSVNRPAVDTYDSDVLAFVMNHDNYAFDDNCYRRAMLAVEEVRGIDVKAGETQMKIEVEVEPRNTHTKSHAGIFTRFQNVNIKKGQLLKAGPTGEGISADAILLEVRKKLQSLSTVEDCKLQENY